MFDSIAYDHLLQSTHDLEIPCSVPVGALESLFIHEVKNGTELSRFSDEILFLQLQGREVILQSNLPFSQQQAGRWWLFQVKEVATFYWQQGSQYINYLPHVEWTVALHRYWLLHTVLPVYLTLEGCYYMLHAGAVEIDANAILFTAPSHGGKSTMTNFFLQQGHPLISDDKVATCERNGVIYAIPSYPFYRPYRKIEDLGYPATCFASGGKPLRVIYELVQDNANADIRISELQGIEKFKSLRLSSEINFPFLKKQRFEYLSQMSSQIVTLRINVPQDLDRLPEVYDQILEHMHNLNL